jgi:hypothetical protein
MASEKQLTAEDLKGIAYFAIGVTSEGKDDAYRLSFCGYTIHEPDGSTKLRPIANSGYSLGEIQTDLGARPQAAQALVDSYRTWVKDNHPDWSVTDTQAATLVADLSRDGHHIRDTDHRQDSKAGKPIPQTGSDIDQTAKARLNDYLATDAGKSFVHQQDVAQVDDLIDKVSPVLQGATFYQQASAADKAQTFAVTAKGYNQSPKHFDELSSIIESGQVHSLADLNRRVDGFPSYMVSGRDDALKGARMFNALRAAGADNAIHASWTAVAANPLIDPTTTANDPTQPHLAQQYDTIKSTFVEPEHGHRFVDALGTAGSYHHGDPSNAKDRGFVASGGNFVQWDRDGHGRAFVDGQWSNFSRDQISITHGADRGLQVRLYHDGQQRILLHVPGSNSAQASPERRVGAPATATPNEATTRHAQGVLSALGYTDSRSPPIPVDGQYGPATRSAITAFQHNNNLSPDGIAGPRTQATLVARFNEKQAVTASVSSAASASTPAASSASSTADLIARNYWQDLAAKGRAVMQQNNQAATQSATTGAPSQPSIKLSL